MIISRTEYEKTNFKFFKEHKTIISSLSIYKCVNMYRERNNQNSCRLVGRGLLVYNSFKINVCLKFKFFMKKFKFSSSNNN